MRALQNKKARVLLEKSDRRRRQAKQRFQQNCRANARTPASVDLTDSKGGAKVIELCVRICVRGEKEEEEMRVREK